MAPEVNCDWDFESFPTNEVIGLRSNDARSASQISPSHQQHLYNSIFRSWRAFFTQAIGGGTTIGYLPLLVALKITGMLRLGRLPEVKHVADMADCIMKKKQVRWEMSKQSNTTVLASAVCWLSTARKKNKWKSGLFICFISAMAGNGVGLRGQTMTKNYSGINYIFFLKFTIFKLITIFFFSGQLFGLEDKILTVYSTGSICKSIHREPVHSSSSTS